MTELELRRKFVECAKSYSGAKQGGAKHKDIVAMYNSYLPHPRGYALALTDYWCAAYASVIAIITELTDIIPVECSCKEQIALWKKFGRWEEDDAYIPSIGDFLYYYWKDDGKGDCTANPNHVGIITDVDGSEITVIEGNKGDEHIVGYRHIEVNGRYIRGFGLPDFASKATENQTQNKSGYCLVQLPILQRGSKGNSVKILQTLLNYHYGFQLSVDGSFGPATERVLRCFQEAKKLAVDGCCGPVTWAALVVY